MNINIFFIFLNVFVLIALLIVYKKNPDSLKSKFARDVEKDIRELQERNAVLEEQLKTLQQNENSKTDTN